MKLLAVLFVIFVIYRAVDGCSFSINVGNADTYEVKEIRRAMEIKRDILYGYKMGMNVDTTLLTQADEVFSKYNLPIW